MNDKFNQLQTVKYGNIGEEIVTNYLLSKGFITYSPANVGAHPFDRLCASRDKKTIFIAEVKTKPARVFMPDTGINLKSYNEYKFVMDRYNINVVMFFVDQDRAKVYGNQLSILVEPFKIEHEGKVIDYPRIEKSKYGKEIIYFPLAKMIHIDNIARDVLDNLKVLSSRNANYAKEIQQGVD